MKTRLFQIQLRCYQVTRQFPTTLLPGSPPIPNHGKRTTVIENFIPKTIYPQIKRLPIVLSISNFRLYRTPPCDHKAAQRVSSPPIPHRPCQQFATRGASGISPLTRTSLPHHGNNLISNAAPCQRPYQRPSPLPALALLTLSTLMHPVGFSSPYYSWVLWLPLSVCGCSSAAHHSTRPQWPTKRCTTTSRTS